LKTIQNYRQLLNEKMIEKKLLQSQLENQRQIQKSWQERYENSLKSRILIQEVAQSIQQTLESYISSIVSKALDAIPFDEKFTFGMEFVTRNNQIECDVFFINKDGERVEPMMGSGGGVKDIASFAIKIALWSLTKKTRPLFIQDEPFKFLHSPILQDATGQMVREICKKHNIQIIMVTDQEDIYQYADKVFFSKDWKSKPLEKKVKSFKRRII
jgi:hypothetical protein